jgi:hypothetical protein
MAQSNKAKMVRSFRQRKTVKDPHALADIIRKAEKRQKSGHPVARKAQASRPKHPR